MTAARNGGTPNPTSIAPQIATGEPDPAAPSSSAPKQNPISTACTRASPDSSPIDRRISANCPVSTVRLYSSIALNTVHPIGSRPNAAPWTNDHPAISTGMP